MVLNAWDVRGAVWGGGVRGTHGRGPSLDVCVWVRSGTGCVYVHWEGQ